MKAHLALVVLFAACGGGGGGGGMGTADAPKSTDAPKVFLDAPPSVPANITISGTASEDTNTSTTPLAGVSVQLFKQSDETTALGTMTTGADGKYTFTIPTGGQVVDAFIKATKSGYADNYGYPSKPFEADATADSSMITSTNFGFLGILSGQQTTNGLIVAEILDSSAAKVSGASITSTPASGKYQYGMNGMPADGTATTSDASGFFINVPPGQVTINATKSGATFKAHSLNAHAGAFTTTTITE